MSRIIKQYPYSKVLDDEAYLKAESVQKISLPIVRLSGIELEENKNYLSSANRLNYINVSLQPKMYAKETEKGIFMYLVELENGEETDKKSEEFIIEEEIFADNLYKAMENEISFDESHYLKEILSNKVLASYTDNYLKRDILLINTYYGGFGIIMSGNTVVGTVDRIKLQQDDDLILTYCVGNFDLNNLVQCKVVFHTHNIWLCFSDIVMRRVMCDNDYFCTYLIESYTMAYSKHGNIFCDIKELPVLVDYSSESCEEFLEQRTTLIEKLQEETDIVQKQSYLDDLL